MIAQAAIRYRLMRSLEIRTEAGGRHPGMTKEDS
jgi:hypothetical protein